MEVKKYLNFPEFYRLEITNNWLNDRFKDSVTKGIMSCMEVVTILNHLMLVLITPLRVFVVIITFCTINKIYEAQIVEFYSQQLCVDSHCHMSFL